MTDSTQTVETYDDGTLVQAVTVVTSYDWAAIPPTVTTTVTDAATGQVVTTETQPVPVPLVASREFSTNLAAELQAYKADRTALIAALDAAVAAIPNNAFTGASELKTALRELADMERATRRMFRAAIRDVSAIDDGSGT